MSGMGFFYTLCCGSTRDISGCCVGGGLIEAFLGGSRAEEEGGRPNRESFLFLFSLFGIRRQAATAVASTEEEVFFTSSFLVLLLSPGKSGIYAACFLAVKSLVLFVQ